MDIHLGLFSERLRRLLAGEEGMFPDAVKQHIYNLQAEINIVASSLRHYEWDLASLLLEIVGRVGQSIALPPMNQALEAIMEEINCFANESDMVIDTFIISITQQKSQSGSNEICDALLGLQNKIIDIKLRLQQVQHTRTDITDGIKLLQAEAAGNSSSSSLSIKNRDIEGLDDRMEELLDLLIEGPPELSVVTILDSFEVNKTTLAAEAYHNNYVKYYFDCHAWVSVSSVFDFIKTMNNIIKCLIPLYELSENMDENNFRKGVVTLRRYLKNKRYLIVLDDVWSNDVWDVILDFFPDNQNGSRVLTTLSRISILTSFNLENHEESIRLDLVPNARPWRVWYKGWSFLVLYHGSVSLKENEFQLEYKPILTNFINHSLLSFHLKPCFLYLSVFPAHFYISTRQLYQLWIAEGLIPDNNEVTAENYLEQLISRGLVEAKKRRATGTIKICSIPGHLWLPLLLVAIWVKFVYNHPFEIPGTSRKNIKRISFNKSHSQAYFLDLLDHRFEFFTDFNSCFHSFLYLPSKSHQLDPIYLEKIWKMFILLRVLDLESLVLSQYPSGIENLYLLRYLKLNIPTLKSLPSSFLSNLLNLYTLDMTSSYIDHVSDEIWKMKKLRHLNVGSIILPAHPENYCSSLENLNFISTLHPCCCTRDILERLPNLRNLRILGDLSCYQSLLSNNIGRLRSLESLKLVNESKMSRLSKIVLIEYQFPPRLTHLSLLNTELVDDPMPALENLQQLQVLKLKQNSYFGRKLTCGTDGFPKLKVLHLKSMFWLEDWSVAIGAMQKLERLIINPCAYLKRLPEHLLSLRSFKKLELWWPQPELRQMLQVFNDKEQHDIQIFPYGI